MSCSQYPLHGIFDNNGGGTSCIFKGSYPDVDLDTVSTWTLDFKNQNFYAAAIIYNVTTATTSDMSFQGNSGFWGAIKPPAPSGTASYIFQGATTVVEASTTVSIVENCYHETPREGSSVVNAFERDCEFDPQSVKIFTNEFVSIGVGEAQYYYIQRDIYFSFSIQFTKGQYFKLTQQSQPFSNAFIAVWIVLFGVGNIGILQLLKGLFESALKIPSRIKHAPSRVSKVFSTDPRGSTTERDSKQPKEEA